MSSYKSPNGLGLADSMELHPASQPDPTQTSPINETQSDPGDKTQPTQLEDVPPSQELEAQPEPEPQSQNPIDDPEFVDSDDSPKSTQTPSKNVNLDNSLPATMDENPGPEFMQFLQKLQHERLKNMRPPTSTPDEAGLPPNTSPDVLETELPDKQPSFVIEETPYESKLCFLAKKDDKWYPSWISRKTYEDSPGPVVVTKTQGESINTDKSLLKPIDLEKGDHILIDGFDGLWKINTQYKITEAPFYTLNGFPQMQVSQDQDGQLVTKEVGVGAIYLLDSTIEDNHRARLERLRELEHPSSEEPIAEAPGSPSSPLVSRKRKRSQRVELAEIRKSPRKSKKHSDTVRAHHTSGVFSRCIFAITGLASNQSRIQQLIEQNGGTLLKDGFSEVVRVSNGKVRWKGSHNVSFGAVISKQHSVPPKTFKYYGALAMGWPCLSAKFIEDCVAKATLLLDQWGDYVLPPMNVNDEFLAKYQSRLEESFLLQQQFEIRMLILSMILPPIYLIKDQNVSDDPYLTLLRIVTGKDVACIPNEDEAPAGSLVISEKGHGKLSLTSNERILVTRHPILRKTITVDRNWLIQCISNRTLQ